MSANVQTAVKAAPFQPTFLAITGLVGVSSILFDVIGLLLKANVPARVAAKLRGQPDPGTTAPLTEKQRRAWCTANAYHLTHTVALMVVAWLAVLTAKGGPRESSVSSAYVKKGFYLMLAGAAGFGTSIYLLAMGLPKTAAMFVGPVTPTSGLILVLGWVNVGLAGLCW